MSIPKKNQLIGLDIGSHSVKLVEINHNRKGRILKNFGTALLPPDAIVEGTIKKPEAVSETITNLFKNLKIKNKKVATSLSGFSVILKKFRINISKEEDMEKKIMEEAENYIPFDIDDVNIDFNITEIDKDTDTEEEVKDGVEVKEVTVVAAKKEIVDIYVDILKNAGLTPSIIDVDVFALENAFEISRPWDPQYDEKSIVLINIGAEKINIHVVKDEVSLFARDLPSLGGLQITRSIISELKVGYEEAERIKAGGIDEKYKKKVGEIIANVVGEWVKEINRNLDFVKSTYPDEELAKIFISGGSSVFPGLDSYISSETGIPVFQLNPFTNLIVDEKKININYLNLMAPQSAIAVGLALRSVDDK